MTDTTTTTWPEQLTFPGQAATHPGPLDMTMMYVMHHAFRRDLTAFAAAAGATPVDDRATWRALAARWELFAEALHHHHSGEDAGLWPALVSRADDDALSVLTAMESEHGEIDPVLAACTAGFARLSTHADDDTRAGLEVRLCGLKESLGRHLQHEETEAIAIMQEVMSAEEWREIEATHFRSTMTVGQLLAVVPWAAHEVPGPLRRQVFARNGAANLVLWWLTRAAFDRRERRAFRHLG